MKFFVLLTSLLDLKKKIKRAEKQNHLQGKWFRDSLLKLKKKATGAACAAQEVIRKAKVELMPLKRSESRANSAYAARLRLQRELEKKDAEIDAMREEMSDLKLQLRSESKEKELQKLRSDLELATSRGHRLELSLAELKKERRVGRKGETKHGRK